MNANEPAISFRILFAYSDFLAQRWLSYFKEHTAALDIDVGGRTGSIRNLVSHIFQAEQFFVQRLLGEQAPAPQKLEGQTLEELELLHKNAHEGLNRYVASADEKQLDQTQAFGPLTVSNRKVLVQAALHSVHHWAQVAMEVRQAGFPADKPQDIIISNVME